MATILAILSNPDDKIKLRSDREIKEINKMISNKAINDINCSTYQAIRLNELPSIMLNNKPDILHFSGHGDENYLMFENNDGNNQKVEINVLKQIFEECGKGIICLFLSACDSKEIADEMSSIIPHVVYFPEKIGDDKAIEFSTSFYEMLVLGKSFESSFKIAKGILSNEFENKENLPELNVNKKLENYRETLYNPPIIIAEFKNTEDEIKMRINESKGLKFDLDIKNLPLNATQIIYEFVDDSFYEEYRFTRVTNLSSGSNCYLPTYGNIVIRAWIWIDSQERGFAISSNLTKALNNHYFPEIPPEYKKGYEYIESH